MLSTFAYVWRDCRHCIDQIPLILSTRASSRTVIVNPTEHLTNVVSNKEVYAGGADIHLNDRIPSTLSGLSYFNPQSPSYPLEQVRTVGLFVFFLNVYKYSTCLLQFFPLIMVLVVLPSNFACVFACKMKKRFSPTRWRCSDISHQQRQRKEILYLFYFHLCQASIE